VQRRRARRAQLLVVRRALVAWDIEGRTRVPRAIV
jgi:hypothetical protein